MLALSHRGQRHRSESIVDRRDKDGIHIGPSDARLPVRLNLAPGIVSGELLSARMVLVGDGGQFDIGRQRLARL